MFKRSQYRKSAPKQYRVALTGGGTAGHVYPCLAIYNILKHKNFVADVRFLGIRGRAEEKIVPKHGIPFETIHSSPMASGSLPARLVSILVIARGTVKSFLHLLRFRPRLVVATGGYVSAPVVLAAFLLKPFLRLRIVIEEQNLVPGLLNKVASLLSDVVLVNYKETNYFVWSNRCVYTGYPVRKEYLEANYDRREIRRRLGIPDEKKLILVMGGSLGARTINRALAAVLGDLSRRLDLFVVHGIGLTGDPGYNAFMDTKRLLQDVLGDRFDPERCVARNEVGEEFYRGAPYLYDIFDYQKAADLVVSRAGAGALAEVAALGKAALIIPKRGLPGDHQELNAIAVARKGGGEVIFEQRDFERETDFIPPDEFLAAILRLLDAPGRRRELETNSRKLFLRESHKVIYATIARLMEGRPLHYILEIVEPDFVKFQTLFDNLIAYLDLESAESGGGADLYRKFFNGKIEEYLRSSDYLVVNKAVKLIGSLKRTDRYGFLTGNFTRFNGFLRRNTLSALLKADEYHESFLEVIRNGLNDGYYEVRAQAIALFRKFFLQLGGEAGLRARVIELMTRRFESFEVKAEAIQTAVLLLEEKEFFRAVEPFFTSRNVRLRQAVLQAIEWGLSHGRFTSSAEVAGALKHMVITTSEFRPEFKIRQSYITVVQRFEAMKAEDPKW